MCKYRHCFGSSGVAADIIKSDLQKSIRRGMETQALKAFFQLYNFNRMFPDYSEAMGLVTNACNRLAVSAAEDAGLNLSLVCGIIEKVMESNKNRSLRSPELFASMIRLLCRSPKSRICSHYWAAYANPANRDLKEKYLPDPTDPPPKSLSEALRSSSLDPRIFGFLWEDDGDSRKKRDVGSSPCFEPARKNSASRQATVSMRPSSAAIWSGTRQKRMNAETSRETEYTQVRTTEAGYTCLAASSGPLS